MNHKKIKEKFYKKKAVEKLRQEKDVGGKGILESQQNT